jgi:hypothetical protein
MTDEHAVYVKISSTDGKNVVESVLNDLTKKAQKGQVEFGVDINITRVEPPQKDAEGGFDDG